MAMQSHGIANFKETSIQTSTNHPNITIVDILLSPASVTHRRHYKRHYKYVKKIPGKYRSSYNFSFFLALFARAAKKRHQHQNVGLGENTFTPRTTCSTTGQIEMLVLTSHRMRVEQIFEIFLTNTALGTAYSIYNTFDPCNFCLKITLK
jgi:hypothetical protein